MPAARPPAAVLPSSASPFTRACHAVALILAVATWLAPAAHAAAEAPVATAPPSRPAVLQPLPRPEDSASPRESHAPETAQAVSPARSARGSAPLPTLIATTVHPVAPAATARPVAASLPATAAQASQARSLAEWRLITQDEGIRRVAEQDAQALQAKAAKRKAGPKRKH